MSIDTYEKHGNLFFGTNNPNQRGNVEILYNWLLAVAGFFVGLLSAISCTVLLVFRLGPTEFALSLGIASGLAFAFCANRLREVMQLEEKNWSIAKEEEARYELEKKMMASNGAMTE